MNLFKTGYLASNLVANVATNTQTTISAIAPIIELAVGIILAFVLSKYLIGLLKEAGKSGDSGKYDLNQYHHSNAEMEAKGINPLGVEFYENDI